MNARSLFVFPVFALAVTACGSAAPDDGAQAAAAEELTTLAPGHYTLVEDATELSGMWIDDVVLRHDHAYDGLFGTDISNVSGHQFSDSGHYALATFKVGPSITFDTYGIEFTYKVQADGTLKVRHLDSDPTFQTRFTLKKAR